MVQLLVQRREYAYGTHKVDACGPRVYSCDTQFASNLRVFNACKQLATY